MWELAGGLKVLADLINNIVNSPFSQLMTLLTKITTPESGFFVSYLIQTALIGCAMNLFRISVLLLLIMLHLVARSLILRPRDFQDYFVRRFKLKIAQSPVRMRIPDIHQIDLW